MRRAPACFRLSTEMLQPPESNGATTLTAEASGQWMLDIWGLVRREIEVAAGGPRECPPPISRTRLLVGSIGAGDRLRHVAPGRLAGGPADQDGRGLQALARRSPRTSTTPARPPSPTSSPPRRRCSTPRRSSSPPACTRAQSEHAIAVLMGRPPAGLSIPHGPCRPRPSIPGASAVVPARAQARRRGGRGDDATGQRADRRRVRRLFS